MKQNNKIQMAPVEPTLAQRIVSPTPTFFRKVRSIGLILGVVGGALLAAPVGLPALVVTIGGYLALAGGVMTAVAQTATQKE